MSLKRRMEAIEAAQSRRQRQMIAATAAAHGLIFDEFMEEPKAFFSLPLAEQLAKVDVIHAELQAEGMSWADIDEIKETLIREYRP
jgi:hypothetical protein